MRLRHAVGVVAAGGGSKAHVDTFVVVAHVGVLGTVLARSALNLFAPHQRVSKKVFWARTFGFVKRGDAGGIHATNGWIVATVSALGHASHQNASR